VQYGQVGVLDLCFVWQYIPPMMKAQVLQIRLTDLEKLGFQAAADLAGIPLSSWVRERLRLAAIRDLESAGQKIPFVVPPRTTFTETEDRGD
jgi:hypothetical protein